MRYLTRPRYMVDPREADPLDVPDDGHAHDASVHGWACSRAGFRMSGILSLGSPDWRRRQIPEGVAFGAATAVPHASQRVTAPRFTG
jgi:hypothetical protein